MLNGKAARTADLENFGRLRSEERDATSEGVKSCQDHQINKAPRRNPEKRMNLKYIRYNLEEAQEEIENIMTQLKRGEPYDQSQFYSSMQHLIHHINIAWNSRHASPVETENATDDDLKRWGKFPTDITLI